MADFPYPSPAVLSSADNPEAAGAAAAEILRSVKEDEQTGPPVITVPFIAEPPDTSVKLPGGGLLHPDGSLYDEAVVRELTGADEEALSKADATKSMVRYVQTLLKLGTERIGKYEKVDEGLLGELLIGDREMLLLAIRRATYGDELDLSLVCPSCASSVRAVFDLSSEIPIKTLEDPTRRVLDVPLRDGRIAKVRIPTSADQNAVLDLTGKTMAEMNTLFLSKCLLSIDDMPSAGRSTVLALGIKDRQILITTMNEAQPGPKYGEVKLECPGCGLEFPLEISILTLFRG